MSNPRNDTLTGIDGFRVGHATDLQGGTGLTVILCDPPAIGAVDISGMSTSSRQIDSLGMMHPGSAVHALCLTGGSAFGLDASAGIARYLEERGVGLDLFIARLPVVPTAALFDLSFMDSKARPNPEIAYAACLSASSAPVEQGCVGAGTGATCGKLRGVQGATKAGLGSILIEGTGGVRVGALVVANAFGDILDEAGKIIAGARTGEGFLNSSQAIAGGEIRTRIGSPTSTTLCVIATDAKLDKILAMQVARMAGHGLSMHISPFNSPFDGDMVFCLSIGNRHAHPLHLGVLAAKAASIALLNAVRHAVSMGGIPASRDVLG